MGTIYDWNFGDNTANTNEVNPVHTFPTEVGSYTITLYTINDAGCEDSINMVITVEDVLIFYVPNSFTPDGDGINDELDNF